MLQWHQYNLSVTM